MVSPPIIADVFFLLLIGSMFWLLSNTSSNDAITCETQGGPAGEEGKVTCHFHQDIKKTKRSVALEMLMPDHSDLSETVSYCWWTEAGEQSCKNKDGVQCDVGEEDLRVTILRMTSEYEGHYKCLSFPRDDTPIKPCQLTVTDPAHPTTEAMERQTSQRPADSSTTSADVCELAEAQKSIRILAVFVGLLSVLSVALSAVLGFRCYKRYKNSQQGTTTRDYHCTKSSSDDLRLYERTETKRNDQQAETDA